MTLPPPPDAVTIGLSTIEVWTDVECNSGVRTAFIPTYECTSITEYVELAGEDYVEIEAPQSASWFSEIEHGRVLRLTYSDDTVREYRIRVIDVGRSSNEVLLRVRAIAIKFDLAAAPLVQFDQANGVALLHHELVGITAEEMFDALFALGTGIWPNYFQKGTIDTTDDYTISWDWETVLSALEEAAKVTDLNLRIRRNGATNYLVDMVADLSASAEIPEIRFRRNVLSLSYEEDTTSIATLIYPKGEGPQGNHPTIGDTRFYAEALAAEPTTSYRLHAWDGAETSGQFYLINEDDQFNDFYIEHSGGVVTQINDSAIALSNKAIDVTLASSVSIDGLIVRMCRGAATDGNRDMTYIPLPSAVAVYGEIPLVLEREDIPGVTNLKGDPFCEDYRAGANLMYLGDGGTTITEVSTPSPYIHYGSKCLKVEMDAGDGLNVTMGENAAWSQNRDDIVLNNPHLSFQTWLYLQVGQVEHFVQFQNAPNWPRYPALDAVDEETGELLNSVTTDHIKTGAETPDGEPDPGNFFHLTLEPQKIDFVDNTPQPENEWANSRVTWRYKALKDGTVWYLDAIQLVNSVVVAEKIVHGSSSLQLWDAAIRAFGAGNNKSVAEPKTQVDISAVDLYRLDSATYQYDEIAPGVQVRITDPQVVSGILREVQSVRRDLKNRAVTSIELVEEDVT